MAWQKQGEISLLHKSAYADIYSTMKQAAKIFKALSDETRLRILALLSQRELCVCDLMAVLELPQSTVSRHLAYLRNAGWVEDRRQGVWMHYRLEEGSTSFQQALHQVLARFLVENAVAVGDREKLDVFLKNKDAGCGLG